MAQSRTEGNKTLSKREAPRDIKKRDNRGEKPGAKCSSKSGRHNHVLDTRYLSIFTGYIGHVHTKEGYLGSQDTILLPHLNRAKGPNAPLIVISVLNFKLFLLFCF